VSFDPTKGAIDDPPKVTSTAEVNQNCARCGHRYANHGEKGCVFHHARGLLCPCKAFRKPAK
jgi:hypothetical protein